jgi:methionyl-tRNA formyltransferase
MRIVFFGASELGYQCCEALLEMGQNVVGIFTIPQQFKISYSKDKPVNNVLFRDFHQLGKAYNIPVIDVEGKMGEYYEQLAALQPDFLLVIGWYYMIPKNLRELAAKGCAGIHASLLPKYRGGAPLVWAMINGETTTGISFFYFSDGVDDGELIAQVKFAIEPEDTIKNLLEKTQKASLEVVKEYVPKIAEGTAPKLPQVGEPTYVPQRKPEDGLIDWTWDKEKIKRFIKAQTKPYPGAFTIINGKKVTIWDADILDV